MQGVTLSLTNRWTLSSTKQEASMQVIVTLQEPQSVSNDSLSLDVSDFSLLVYGKHDLWLLPSINA